MQEQKKSELTSERRATEEQPAVARSRMKWQEQEAEADRQREEATRRSQERSPAVTQHEPEPEPQGYDDQQQGYDDQQQGYDQADRGQVQESEDAQPQGEGLTARALYDYQAEGEDELTFDPDEIITDIEQIDDGWWMGNNPRGERGLFPANYVELI